MPCHLLDMQDWTKNLEQLRMVMTRTPQEVSRQLDARCPGVRLWPPSRMTPRGTLIAADGRNADPYG
jgi:hypothetical protein